MRVLSIFLLIAICSACSNKEYGNFVFVKGGTCKNSRSNLYGTSITIADFYLGKYEVTQKEWKEVMGSNPSKFQGDSLPVEMVNWYDCVEYCIKRSQKEGLQPYYSIDKNGIDKNNIGEFDSLKWIVTVNPDANGYRLPSEAEWEYAAGGGVQTKSCQYSGSNDIDKVSWYWRNAGDNILTGTWNWPDLERNHNKTKPVGRKLPNELGLYDMSGNVREWCEDWYVDQQTQPGISRSQRGGGWMGSELRCEIASRDNFETVGRGPDQGFRICRSK